jgi:hypothetical protein
VRPTFVLNETDRESWCVAPAVTQNVWDVVNTKLEVGTVITLIWRHVIWSVTYHLLDGVDTRVKALQLIVMAVVNGASN